MASVTFDLPRPPSVNGLWRSVNAHERKMAAMRGVKLPGRLKSEPYMAWLKEAGLVIMASRVKLEVREIKGPYRLAIIVRRGAADLGNLEKSVSDLLVEMRVIEDDSLAEQIVLGWGDVVGCRVTIQSWEEKFRKAQNVLDGDI